MNPTQTLVKKILSSVMLLTLLVVAVPASAYAGTTCGGGEDSNGNPYPHATTTIDIGCKGKGDPIMDALFGIVRFLSDGVGLVIIGSIIVGGVQYTTSSGDPAASEKATKRIRSSVIALLVFLFAYPLLNYIIPSGFLKQ